MGHIMTDNILRWAFFFSTYWTYGNFSLLSFWNLPSGFTLRLAPTAYSWVVGLPGRPSFSHPARKRGLATIFWIFPSSFCLSPQLLLIPWELKSPTDSGDLEPCTPSPLSWGHTLLNLSWNGDWDKKCYFSSPECDSCLSSNIFALLPKVGFQKSTRGDGKVWEGHRGSPGFCFSFLNVQSTEQGTRGYPAASCPQAWDKCEWCVCWFLRYIHSAKLWRESEPLAWRGSRALSPELRVKAYEVIEKLALCAGTYSRPWFVGERFLETKVVLFRSGRSKGQHFLNK